MRKVAIPALILLLIPLAAAGTPQLSVEVGNGQACPTESGEYALEIHNPGPASDRYSLEVDAPWSGSDTLTDSRPEVAAGDTETVYMWIQVPKTASRGDHGFTVSATSSNTGEEVITGGELRVLSCRAVSLETVQDSEKVCRGEEAVYRFEVENEGQVEETYRLTSDFGTLSTRKVILAPGDSGQVRLTASSTEEMNRSVQVRAESTSSYASDTSQVAFKSERCRGVEVAVAPENSSLCRSETLTLTSSVTNTGSIDDTYTLVIGGEEQNVTVNSGQTTTVESDFPARSVEGNLQVIARSNSFSRVQDSSVSTVEVERCHDLSLEPVTSPDPGNRTLLHLSLSNNGTRINNYTLQLDGPDWMDVKPQSAVLEPGQESTVYVYIAPDFFGDGDYTAALVAEGEGIRKTFDMNLSASNGTVSVELQGTRTPTGLVPASTSGLVSILVTALILLFGGYWFFRREKEDGLLSAVSRDYRMSADDYLDQNANRVVRSIRDDSLSESFLEVLLEEERHDKNREMVVNQIRREIKERRQGEGS